MEELGKKGDTEVTEDLSQLHMRDTFFPKSAEHLTEEQNQDSLKYLLFFKLENERRLKGQTCVDGQKQRKKAVPGDANPPTVSMESVLITEIIDVHERRHVRICDIPGAFLSADMDAHTKMALCGRLEETILNISLQIYRHHVINKKERMVIYVTTKKALYRCLIFALIFYELLVSDMRGKGFELNPYDPCVASKFIVGKQMIIFWHVDNLKVSHVEPK